MKREAEPLMFTVATPTFNRAHTLPRVYESLEQQTFRSFEWLVVDDGSTDATRELVGAWTDSASFPVRYVYQSNAGKGAAENRAADLAHGDFLAILDSDDWYLPTALEVFADTWQTIGEDERDSFCGIVALCLDTTGAVNGDRFPGDVLDTDYTELRSRYRVRGDKIGCMRIDVARRFPHPTFEGERRRVYTATVLRRIAREYQCRCVNRPVAVVDYQPDGMSAGGMALMVASPRSAKLYMLETLLDDDLGFLTRLKHYAHHVRFAAHAGLTRQSWVDAPSKLMWMMTAPLGGALYLRDRWLARRVRSIPT
jgi:glycosyltransferase involved in cell wall biosynthesis